MSSPATEGHGTSQSQSRTKNVKTRACDMCRRRKMRCDGNKNPNGICTPCIAQRYKCTYVQTSSKRPTDARYVEALEIQVAEMRSLLAKYRQLYPDGEKSGRLDRIPTLSTNFVPTTTDASEVSPSPAPEPVAGSSSSTPSPSLPIHPPYISVSPIPTAALTDEDPDCDSSDDEVSARRALVLPFTRLTLNFDEENFQGKASSMMFVKAALHSKRQSLDASAQGGGSFVDEHNGASGDRRHAESAGNSSEKVDAGKATAVRKGAELSPAEDFGIRFHSARPQVWSEHEWILKTTEEPQVPYVFPPQDLMDDLLAIYFSTTNLFSPVFHEPTFMQDYRSSLHLRNRDFGAIVLLICAEASKRSDDPRVLLDEERLKNEKLGKNATWDGSRYGHGATYYSAGWVWFEQVRRTRLAVSFKQPSLYDMQIEYLIIEYSRESSGSMTVRWSSIASGLRIAQALGAHRKKAIGTRPTVEGELRKRLFWALLLHDRRHSAAFGRPCSIHDEDFDVDLPLACDDEYWIHPDPEKAFKQPEDKPSKVVFFNCMLTLFQIKAYALRTIYSINKSKPLLGLVGRDRQQRIITEIDSALNRWLDHLPPHLKWNPKMENNLFFMQSADLHAQYYGIRIMAHRPFISASRDSTDSFNPSLTICANAARACVNILDEQFKRVHVIHERHPLLMSAIVLLIDVWVGKKANTSTEETKKVQLVYRAMHITKSMERWSPGAARVWDALNNMISAGDWEGPPRSGQSYRPQAQTNADAGPSGVARHDWEREVTVNDAHRSQNFMHTQPQASFFPSHMDTNIPTPSHISQTSRPSHEAAPPWQGLNPGYQPISSSQVPPSSSFVSTSGMLMSEDDVTVHPSIDPMIDALLNMLDPSPFQSSRMFSTPHALTESSVAGPSASQPHHHSNEFPTSATGGAIWDGTMLGPNLSRGMAAGEYPGAAANPASGLAGYPPVGMAAPGGAQFDISASWPQGQNGYPRWEDWAAHLEDFRTYGEDPYGASRGRPS